jgi:putative membrane protein
VVPPDPDPALAPDPAPDRDAVWVVPTRPTWRYAPAMPPPPTPLPANHLIAFLLRLVVSAAVLWLAVAWVSPGNPENTFGRAVLVSIVLSVAYYVTLAKLLWFLLLPWLVYGLVWLLVVMSAYGIGFLRALLLALALTFLSWLVSALLGVRTFRSD